MSEVDEIIFFLLFELLEPMLVFLDVYALHIHFRYAMECVHLPHFAFFDIFQTVLPLLQDIDNCDKLVNHPGKCLRVDIAVFFLRTVGPSILQGLKQQVEVVLVLIEHGEVDVEGYHECVED